mgnify:CR=1 FL=1
MSELNEPSVLDYVKSKLNFRDGAKPELAIVEFESQDSPEGEPEITQVAPLSVAKTPSFLDRFPWRSLLALLLALMGQTIFDLSKNSATVGGFFYLIALGLLIFAYSQGEWQLTQWQRAVSAEPEEAGVSLPFFFMGAFFALFAFISFGPFPLTPFVDNQFTIVNTSLWVLAILFLMRAFWFSTPSTSDGEDKSLGLGWKKWLLIIVASAIILFFRFYQTGTVPAEPFSDHAEKILDVYDITQGQYSVFFPRNTGREAIQMYWTLLIAKIFGTGLSFLSLKLGTALLGLLTLPYIYLLGKEVANERVGLLAFFMFGIAYWPNVISRVGLRFPLYPLFVAPTLFYLLRGIRRQNINDFILSGLFLGLGAHGYSPFRIMPFVVVAAVGLYMLHKQSRGVRKQVFAHFIILAFISLIVFIPLGRYALSYPDSFSSRAFSRLDNPNGDSLQIFVSNVMDGLKMMNWDNGITWVHSVNGRPALDVISGAFFLIGILLLIVRYTRTHHWLDLFLLLSIPLLELPSTLSVAFPQENPALNRAGGAAVTVFIVVALAFDGLLSSLRSRAKRESLSVLGWAVTAILLLFSMGQNYDIVFNQYASNFKSSAWNSSDMGQYIRDFEQMNGQTDTVWIVPYPHWVDTRLPGVWAGIPNRDFALWPDNFADSLDKLSPKLFMLNLQDEASLAELQRLYPHGVVSYYNSDIVGHDFVLFNVP